MQVGEEDLPGPKQWVLFGQGLLHLHDEVGLGEDLLMATDQLRSRCGVLGIGIARAGSGASLDEHAVPAASKLICGGWEERHAVLLSFDFFGAADLHGVD